MTQQRRVLLLLLVAFLLLVLAGGGTAWWYQTTRPEYRLRVGREAVHQGDFPKADHLAGLLEADGEVDRAHLLRGELLLARAHTILDTEPSDALGQSLAEQAHDQLNLIRDTGELRTEAAYVDGLCLHLLGSDREAERALSWALTEKPDLIDAHRTLAAIYYDQGMMPAAIKHLGEVIRLDPTDGRPDRLIGLIYKDQERYDYAIEHYRAALGRHLAPQTVEETRSELAEVLIKTGEYKEALQTLEAYDQDSLVRPDVAALKLEAMLYTGTDREAIAAQLDKALADSPTTPALLRLRAHIYRDKKQPREAANMLKRAVEADLSDYATQLEYAQVLGQLKDPAAAEQEKRAEEMGRLRRELSTLTDQAKAEPWNAEVREQLAVLCQQLHLPLLAKRWKKSAAACGPRPTATGAAPR